MFRQNELLEQKLSFALQNTLIFKRKERENLKDQLHLEGPPKSPSPDGIHGSHDRWNCDFHSESRAYSPTRASKIQAENTPFSLHEDRPGLDRPDRTPRLHF